MRLGLLVISFRCQGIDEIIVRRPFIFQADTPAARIALLLSGTKNGAAGRVPTVVVGVVGFVVIIHRTGEFMFVTRLPDAGSHQRVGMPVGRISLVGAAVVTRFLTIAAAINKHPAQLFITRRCGNAVMPAAVSGVVIALVTKIGRFGR
ncbi:hypothetical protein D3C79_842540 [compost metagenome]